MNSGKICIPVCASTADEMIAEIMRAAELADIIEVRFDCLESGIPDLKSEDLKTGIPLLATYRSPEQGGNGRASLDERIAFWDRAQNDFWACDLEEDVIGSVNGWPTRIASFHDFKGVPSDIDDIYERLAATGADIIKIAVTANDIADAILLWKLIGRANADGKQIIPIAMGEAGVWTRILGLAHGTFLTFASLDTGKETAGGQITARDMIDVYRVKELDKETRVYGVIGDPVAQSMSPRMQNAALRSVGENAVYLPLLIKDIDSFMERMVKPRTREVDLNFAGFSVTIPHKRSIMRYLDEIDPIADKIGAVNTVKIDANGKMTGYNTDAYGFITPLKAGYGDLRGAKVAIFGAGGSARACVYALKQEGADVSVFVRDPSKAAAFSSDFGVTVSTISSTLPASCDILVNATPIGMKGSLENESLFTSAELLGVKFVFDLVTKTTDTPLIREAKRAGIPAIGGVEMLIAQGERQFEIWTGREAPIDLMCETLTSRIAN